MIKIDLQHFADEEELIDGEVEENEASDEQEEQEDEIVEEEDPLDEEPIEEEPAAPAKKDKVTTALIKKKQELKELKTRLAEYENREREKELYEKKKQIAARLIEKGYDEDEAVKMAEKDTKIELMEKKLEKLEYERKFERLESKYPEIWDNFDKFIDLSKKTGWSIEKIARIEFGESNEFEVRTKTEQAALIARQKAAKAKPVTSTQTPLQTVKLSPGDEKAYQTYLKFNPGASRKQYKENILNAKFEEKW